MPNTKRLAVLVLAAAIVAPGCGSSDCEKAYESMKKCAAGKDNEILKDKDTFVLACEMAQKDPELKESFQSEMECFKQDSCEKVEACKKGQLGKRRAKRIQEEVAAGKWKDAFSSCTLSADYYADETYKAECSKVFANADKLQGEGMSSLMFRCKSGDEIKKVSPDFEKACKTLAGGQLGNAQKAVTAARDAGKNEYSACSELKRAAELAGGDAVATAQKACDEMAASEDAKKATEEARANVTAKKANMPFKCDMAAEKLSKLDTEWAKKTLDDVYKACYVELGAFVIAEKGGKDAKYVCPYQIKQIMDAVAKRDLTTKFPELAETLKKLPAKCQQK